MLSGFASMRVRDTSKWRPPTLNLTVSTIVAAVIDQSSIYDLIAYDTKSLRGYENFDLKVQHEHEHIFILKLKVLCYENSKYSQPQLMITSGT